MRDCKYREQEEEHFTVQHVDVTIFFFCDSAMSEKLPPGTLCAVCEDLATGKHYSVASCNGCKTFFRRAIVNKREFSCQGNGHCPVNKGVRCACRYCRLQKCLVVGMDKNSIQNDRDRIGYTKRKRKNDEKGTKEHENLEFAGPSSSVHNGASDGSDHHDLMHSPGESNELCDVKVDHTVVEPIAERLTTLENNFSLLLSRCPDLKSYATLEEALNAPSRFNQAVNCDWSDPLVLPHHDNEKMPFWRQRLIALYIDWAKTFTAFKNLPYTDKVALITNHASSFMILCEAFRTPEHVKSDMVRKRPELSEIVAGASEAGSRVASTVGSNHSASDFPYDHHLSYPLDVFNPRMDNMQLLGAEDLLSRSSSHSSSNSFQPKPNFPLTFKDVKTEPSDSPEPKPEMIRLPTEYGSLPADYASWIPKDYGHPTAGIEGRSDIHNFLDAREFCEVGRPSSCSFSEKSMKTATLMVPKTSVSALPVPSLSGITPVMAMMIDLVMKPARLLNFSTTEFALLQAVMFFDPDTDGLDSASQRNVIAEQKKLLGVLFRHLQKIYSPSDANDRYSAILLRIPSIRRAAAKKNESLQVLDMLQMHVMNSLVKETSLGPRPTSVQQRMGIGGGASGMTTLNIGNHI
ncbi:unnamed protein product [Caenorhabditis auriculariae]|uniref:Uncharacterized protein n=1 Tax=Caenorhabditis auriculariae TaxID=2777116 RepID=A0A8S1GTX1_9PELO|nr:unnamed protein product [Caenorhabditis auriculariae]